MDSSVLHAGATEDRGENARLQSYVGAIAIGDLVKSTLGPKGMDKILQPMPGEGARIGKTTVTNDGATILKAVWVDNPSAKILVDMSKTQDTTCGDGTTSVVVLAAEMLRQAERLVDAKMHPQVVIKGYREALKVSLQTLEANASDHGKDPDSFRKDLINIAQTTLSSKLLRHEKEHFAELAVSAVLRLKGKPNLDYIQVIEKQGGSLKDSFLEEGFILEKRIVVGQKEIRDCKVMVANTPMDTDKIKIYGSRVKVDSFESVAELEKAEKEKMKTKVDKICAHGCNVFINRQLIYNYPEQCFREHGVVAIEHSDFDGAERLAAVLGADIVSTFNDPENTKLGTCEVIREIMIGEDKVVQFKGCKQGEACSIVLRGSSAHVLAEARRSLHDAIAVIYATVQETRVVYGGGAMEMEMAKAVSAAAGKTEGKHAVAMESFATALTQIPSILADNAGYDAAELISQLRVGHSNGDASLGLDLNKGIVGDMKANGILESYKSKLSGLCAAAEAAEQVIRVDNIIRCPQRQRQHG
jgi:T-complex protein 1 subunit beta